MVLYSRNFQALLFGCLLWTSESLTITTIDGMTSFAPGSVANLTCTHQAYAGYSNWTVDSVTVEECIVTTCMKSTALNQTRYFYLNAATSGIFVFAINPVQTVDDGKVIGCSDGTITSRFTIHVTGTMTPPVKNQTNHPLHLDNVTQSSGWQTVSYLKVTQITEKSSQVNFIFITSISLVGLCVVTLIIVSICIWWKCARKLYRSSAR